ncbi:secretin N-terminal domain-containing protein [Candidatus Omnitrophota bacterium]
MIRRLVLISAALLGLGLYLGETLDGVAQEAASFSTLIEEAMEARSEEPTMDKRISLDLRGLNITDAFKYLSIQGGMNIVVNKNVSGRVTFMITDVPIRDVFDVILRSNGLAYEKRGNVYTIMTETEYKQLYGKQFSDIREVKLFRLKYAVPENAFILVDAIKTEIGRVVVDQETGTLLIMDTPEKIKEIEEAIAILEKKNNIQIFDLKYAKAKDIEEQLKERLDAKKVGSIKADERSNQVVVQAFSGRMEDIEQLIESFDRKTREVIIDAKIIKITLSDGSEMGVEWEGLIKSTEGFNFLGTHAFNPLDRLGTSFIDQYAARVQTAPDDPTADINSQWNKIFTSTAAPTAGTKTAISEKIYFGRADQWEAVLSFLDTIGHTKILSNPRLAVVNNQEAKIHVGKREAYVTTTTTTGQTTSTVSEDVTFIDVGIQLSVTPTINNDGYVTMKIKPEISSVVGSLRTPTNNLIPIVDTSMAETTVMVKDSSTIIIGGLRKNEKVHSSRQVPFFGRIPLLGNLFKMQTNEDEVTELLILITPHVIEGDRLLTAGDFQEEGEEGIKNVYRDYTSVQNIEAE